MLKRCWDLGSHHAADNTLLWHKHCSVLSIPKPWSLLQEAVNYKLSPLDVFGDTQGMQRDSITGKQIK